MALNLFCNLPATHAADWLNTGFSLRSLYSGSFNYLNCLDGTQPYTLLFSKNDDVSYPKGTYSYNWQTGQKTFISQLPFEFCDARSGYMFTEDNHKIYRFSSSDPAGRLIEHMPGEIAKDASQQMYAHGQDGDINWYASSDAGLTWGKINSPRNANSSQYGINSIYSSPGDAKSIYAVDCFYRNTQDCPLYFSSDAGQNWQMRNNNFIHETDVVSRFEPIDGVGTPVNYVLVSTAEIGRRRLSLSTDGGHSFTEIGAYEVNDSPHGGPTNQTIKVYYTGHRLVRFTDLPGHISLDASEDGRSWIGQTLPPGIGPLDRNYPPHLSRLSFSDSAFVLSYIPQGSTQYTTWFTSDDGSSWTKLGDNHEVTMVTPYLPTSLLALDNGNLSVLNYANADHFVTNGVNPTGSANSLYFPQTGHTLTGDIRRFWEQHGGLPQFGYPLTEVAREYNQADGKVYAVQYFERNRLEYHPELAGTPYEVELGLLGNQLIEGRHNERPFRPVSNPDQPGFNYFTQTGHTLAHTFRDYWEAHGGLAIYGYPTSEEFQEVNPSDGQTYTVQYFERNRFEYHPEFKNTPYEVLLGLLGDQLLKQKGWL
jgi:hypothetical protein